MYLPYEKLLNEASQHSIDIYEKPMKSKIKGLYSDRIVWINKNLSTSVEKACVLAEELGHYHTSTGDILDQSKIENRKQEKQARKWAYKKLIPLPKFINAYNKGIDSKFELAEYLGVTEAFLLEAVKKYKEEFGLYTQVDRYTIYFEPLAIMEMFED